MPAYLKALVVIVLLSGTVLWLMRRVATEKAITPEDYKRRAIVWMSLTLLAFLAHNYWLYALISVTMLLIAGGRDTNRLCFFFFLIFAIPPFTVEVPGFGVFERLLQVDHIRWMALVVLLPAWLSLRNQPDVTPFGRTFIDKVVLAYMVLWFVLQLAATTLTNQLRITLYLFIDTFLPYYVASRALRNLRDYRDALMSFGIAALVMAPVALFELLRSWLLYNGLEIALGLPYWGMGNYLERGDGGLLRASATTGHPIALGYVMSVALGMSIFLRMSIASKRSWSFVVGGLGIGLIAAMSRGPWVGAAAMFCIILSTGPNIASKMGRTAALAMVGIPLLLTTEKGQKILDYLPFIGTLESRNVDFRQRLFEVCIGVLSNFPFFGALDFMSHPDMEQMRGSDGIIDMVNTYLTVAMMTGGVGFTLFVGPFVLAVLGILRTLHRIPDKHSEMHLLGRALLAALVTVMVSIATLSSILCVPVVYLTAIGLAAGYLRLAAAAQTVTSSNAGIVQPRPNGHPPRGPAPAAARGPARAPVRGHR